MRPSFEVPSLRLAMTAVFPTRRHFLQWLAAAAIPCLGIWLAVATVVEGRRDEAASLRLRTQSLAAENDRVDEYRWEWNLGAANAVLRRDIVRRTLGPGQTAALADEVRAACLKQGLTGRQVVVYVGQAGPGLPPILSIDVTGTDQSVNRMLEAVASVSKTLVLHKIAMKTDPKGRSRGFSSFKFLPVWSATDQEGTMEIKRFGAQ